jgi:nitrite reductase/ring-hydroxylating ferredoxin subunit
MDNIPVAKPKPIPREWKFRRRGLLLAMVALMIAAGAATIVMNAWPKSEDAVVLAGTLDEIEPGSVRHFEKDGFFLVSLEDGSFLALYDEATGHLNDPIEWKPDFEFQGVRGWFRSPWHNETYDREGNLMFGPAARGMDRHKVSFAGRSVIVDTSTLYCLDAKQTRGSTPCQPLGASDPVNPPQ